MSGDPFQSAFGTPPEEAQARLLDARRVLIGLQRRNRFLRAALAAGVVMLIVGGVLAAGGIESGTVKAEKFVLTDSLGECRAELSMTTFTKLDKTVVYWPRLVLYGADGKPRVSACFRQGVWPGSSETDGSSELTFTDADGNRRVVIVHDVLPSDENTRVTLLRRNKSACSFGVNTQRSSYIEMSGSDGHSWLDLRARGDTAMHYLSMIKTTPTCKASLGIRTHTDEVLELRHSRPQWGRVSLGIWPHTHTEPDSAYLSISDHLKQARKRSTH